MRNPELDRLKATQQSLFEQKQVAFAHYTYIRDEASRAHDVMEAAWQERTSAREEMNREFEARRSAYAHHDAIWEEYRRIRDKNNYEIDYLKREADAEHAAMKECFDRASDAYQYGDKSEAPMFSAEGHEHKDSRDSLNAEISRLIAEVKDAKASAEAQAPPVSSADFDRAKAEFERAKAHHEAAQAEFKRLKTERDRAKAEFDRLQAEFKRAQDAFRAKLDEVKRARTAEKETTINAASKALAVGTSYFDGRPAKIIPDKKRPGWRHVFFMDSGNYGDAKGHGHIVLDPDNNVRYYRDQWQAHKDYLIDEAKDNHTKT